MAADGSAHAQIPSHLNIADEFVARPAQAHPERVAILGEPRAFTYREVEEAVNRAANVFRSWNCAPGDRVLVILPDSIEFIAAFFGAAKIGAIAVPVNSMARAADYAYYLADSGARFAIVHKSVVGEFALEDWPPGFEVMAIAAQGFAEIACEVSRYAKGFFAPRIVSWEEQCNTASPNCDSHRTAANDPAFFLYTSGSGGTPKAAIHRHEDMLHTSRGYAHGVLGLRPDDITYSVSKLFFAYGLGNGMYFPFSVGARTVLDPGKPKPERTAELLKKYRPTILFSVPTFFAALLREAARGLDVDCSSLRMAVSAGETLPAEIFEQFKNKFGAEILDGIGSTEMLHMFLSSRPGKARAASCGSEVPGCAAKILGDDGAEVPRGEIGNLWVRGGSAFAGYWKKPELTARTKKGEWVLTGDKFTCDADGYFHYCGRADDMMKVAGMWVSPSEVENALLAHPDIAEVAVVAHADENGLLHPAAYVVLKNDVACSENLSREIREFLRKNLVSYKCPQTVHFVENLPKTATGKIQRFLLRDANR
ncbi:MAG TPA: benzoate-CoA ligase family protein [Candidatus Acidoferrales bacterium]|nr:benzoate-CoA ligase family protein [Candidatus Acidoferrales bacterium]